MKQITSPCCQRARVYVSGEFLKVPVKMSKDTSGVWSVTVPPVTPEIYPYSFWVDSVSIATI